jgi:L,D-transpeptidase ErfK/SrfK
MLSSAVSAILVLIASPLVQAAAYTLPEDGDSVVGVVTTLRLKYEDTLAGVAQQYGIGFQELVDANPGVDPWLPGDGTVIRLPTEYVLPEGPRDGVVINVAEYRLYYYQPDAARVITYPVGIGRDDFPTPLLETKVVGRIENPSWTPTAAARKEHAEIGDILPTVVGPGPDNPLGKMAIQLAAPGYFIHGTNKPFGVGQMVSMGCIRLYDEHIATLAEMVRRGTPVHIVNQPFKLGWRGSELYAESHQDMYTKVPREVIVAKVRDAVSGRHAEVDWQLLDQELQGPTGVPVKLESGPGNQPAQEARAGTEISPFESYLREQQVSEIR